jgi:hypothetical protein
LQDCEVGLGCYFNDEGGIACHSSGVSVAGEPCARNNDCAPGNLCMFGTPSLCAPYCDSLDASSEQACAKLCPAAIVSLRAAAGSDEVVTGCLPGAGGACDPLAPECDDGSACYGTQATGCAVAGSVAQGQECSAGPTDCVPGTTCVGRQGSVARYCQPYCDPANAAADNACATLCPGAFWTLGSYGLCMPDA